MNDHLKTILFAASLCTLAPVVASAHAFLDRAVPGVGSTVSGSPGELQLSFTQNVVVALSGVRIASAGGAAVAVSKPTGDAASPNVLHVRLGRALPPGVYLVTWHVVSVDTHPTSGSYKFTVVP